MKHPRFREHFATTSCRCSYWIAGSHEAAQRVAMFYSLAGACMLKGVEPYQWLKNVLQVLRTALKNYFPEKCAGSGFLIYLSGNLS